MSCQAFPFSFFHCHVQARAAVERKNDDVHVGGRFLSLPKTPKKEISRERKDNTDLLSGVRLRKGKRQGWDKQHALPLLMMTPLVPLLYPMSYDEKCAHWRVFSCL
mgnify:FL=1